MNSCTSGPGASYARSKRMKRDRYGTKVTITPHGGGAAKTVAAEVRKTDPRDRDYLPEAGRNVSFSDIRIYEATPSDVAGVSEGDGLAEQGQAFTVIGVPPADVVAGVAHTQVLVCYRTPPVPDSSEGVSSGAASFPTPDATL